MKVAGYTWDLFTGYNGAMRVYSFVVPNGSPIYSFTADVKEFFNYLTTTQNFPASQQYMLSELARSAKLTKKPFLSLSSYVRRRMNSADACSM